ncbi:leucine-rich repeat domain-containing protein [Carboxylicivirga sp. RSCT41]|uniref:leucine-rich repeat domain-containing protein n=1 Tax=Carboxylicivirga agarovorans TaxID=3417570 RepID=UPI003D32A3DE
MKHLITLIIFVAIGLMSAQAQWILTSGDVEMSGNTITAYVGTKTDIIIPATINIDGNDVEVKEIGANAFQSKGLTKVVLSDGITTLNGFSFADNEITELTLPTTLATITGGDFNNNKITTLNGAASKGLIYARNSDATVDETTIVSYGGDATTVNFIPDAVTTIGDNAFSHTLVEHFTIGSNVTALGDRSFDECSNLQTISLTNGKLTEIGQYAFHKSLGLNSVEIPSTVTTLGDGVFSYSSLKEATFESGTDIEVLPQLMFENAGSLQQFEVPNSVTKIGNYCFMRSGIEEFTFESSSKVVSIGSHCFQETDLGAISIPASVTTIYSAAFQACENLSYVSFDEGSQISTFGSYLFRDCTINTLVFPETVNVMGTDFFDGAHIENLVFMSNPGSINPNAFRNSNITFVNGMPFDNGLLFLHRDDNGTLDKTRISAYVGSATKINFIPAEVKTISTNAFKDKNISSVSIPASVTTIEDGAFADNTSLSSLEFESGSLLQSIGSNAFENCYFTSLEIPA